MKGSVGRPPEADVARTEIYKVRLTPAEKKAIEEMEINLGELVRAIIQARIATKEKAA